MELEVYMEEVFQFLWERESDLFSMLFDQFR